MIDYILSMVFCKKISRVFLPTAIFFFFFCSAALAQHDDELRKTPVVRAVEQAAPSVVNIITMTTVRREAGPFGFWLEDEFWPPIGRLFERPEFSNRQVRQSLGSGVIIDGEKGLVLSNDHVISGASSIKVRLADGREFEAELVGSNADFDLAVLSLKKASFLPQAILGNSDQIMIGEEVIAIGNPYGLSHTVTTGVVSALGRSVATQKHGLYTDFIQTDAAINPGNSGGPLLNILGQVIGINTAIYAQGSGIGFAIPINKAGRVVDELLSKGQVSPVWLGMFGQNLDERTAGYLGLPNRRGLLVTEIYPDSPAKQAAIRPGDLIRSIDGVEIEDRDHYLQILRNHTQNEDLILDLIRDGRNMEFKVRTATFTLDMARSLALNLWGIAFEKGRSGRDGLLVIEARRNFPASQAVLKPGDMVLQIGPQVLKTDQDFTQAVLKGYMQRNLLIAVVRDDRLYYARMRL